MFGKEAIHLPGRSPRRLIPSPMKVGGREGCCARSPATGGPTACVSRAVLAFLRSAPARALSAHPPDPPDSAADPAPTPHWSYAFRAGTAAPFAAYTGP